MAHNSGESSDVRWWSRDWVALTTVALVLFVDQLSKFWVRSSMYPGQSLLTWSPVQLTYVLNTGSAFGLFPRQALFLIVAAFVGIGVLFVYYRHIPHPPLLFKISLGMMMGGAIGNLVDRLRYGSVTDFIDLRFFPVFNVSDSSITVGAIVLGYVLLSGSGDVKPTDGASVATKDVG